jgi:CBS domain-containing protein
MSRFTVADVMTPDVVYLPAATTLDEAAQAMRDAQIGDVVVTDGATLSGIVTDRDIVVRALAEGLAPRTTTIGEIATRELLMIPSGASAAEAIQVMRERAVRRLLVCDVDRQIVGIVSLHDMALHPRLVEAVAEPPSVVTPAPRDAAVPPVGAA